MPTATPHTTYDWVREVSLELKALDTIPLTGAAPTFPWDDFAARLARSFDREGLVIKPGEITWRAKDKLYEGLGSSPSILVFTIPSLRGQIDWVMPEQEVATLETLLLTKESHPIPFQDKTLRDSFFRFCALEVLYQLTQISFDKTIAPVLSSEPPLEPQDALTLDISLTYHHYTLWGRLILSQEMRQSWVEHYANREPSILSKELAETITVTAHLEAGRTSLNLKQWMSVQEGDFLLLDSCSLDPDNLSSGRLMLTVNNRQAFRVKLKDHQIKILELPIFQEVRAYMNEDDEDENNDSFSASEASSFGEESLEGLNDDWTMTEDEETIHAETEADKEESDEAEDHQTAEAAPAPTQPVAPVEEKGPISAEKIPVALTVEVGRIRMSVDKLLKLEPGNLLELEVHPEDGVDLTINGELVGRGELIRLGDLLGVRILQLGQRLP